MKRSSPQHRPISLSGELRWFLSCMDSEADYFIPLECGEAILDFWRSLGAMAETIDRFIHGSSHQLTLATRCIITALRTLSERDNGEPRAIEIKRTDLPRWRAAIGNAIALAAAAEAELDGRLAFFDGRRDRLFAAVTSAPDRVAP
jgi:hypothetical protein